MQPPKKLQALWNRKLRESGFQDAEKRDGNLKDYHGMSFSKFLPEELEERRRYFMLAAELGRGYEDEWGNWIDVFEGNERNRSIWLKYCEGKSEEVLAKQFSLSPRTISRIVNKYNKFIVR